MPNAFKTVFSNKGYLALAAVISLAVGVAFYFLYGGWLGFRILFDYRGNAVGAMYLVSAVLITLLFGINIAFLAYRTKISRSLSKKEGGSTVVATVGAVLGAGCPVCGTSLAAVLGAGAAVASLPFKGLELQFVSLALLGVSTGLLTRWISKCDTCVAKPLNRTRKGRK